MASTFWTPWAKPLSKSPSDESGSPWTSAAGLAALPDFADTPAELKRRHGAETLITVTVEGDLAPLAERAERLEGVRSVERDEQVLRVHASRSEGVLAKLVQEAAELGLAVTDASSLPPSLETVFLNLTGREYRQ